MNADLNLYNSSFLQKSLKMTVKRKTNEKQDVNKTVTVEKFHNKNEKSNKNVSYDKLQNLKNKESGRSLKDRKV